MLFESLLKKNPEEVFIYLERNVNARFPLQGEFVDVPEVYRPDIGEEKFEIPFSILEDYEAEYFEFFPDLEIKKTMTQGGNKFFIHPVMVSDYIEKGMMNVLRFHGSFSVSPTSSTRSLLTRDRDKNFMIKVNLERRLGENVRKLKRNQIEHSNKIMQELGKAELPDGFGYFPETIGLSYSICNDREDNKDYQAGMLVREFATRPVVDDKRFVIPFFSLFSLDKNNKEHDPLLAQIVEHVAGNLGVSEYEVFVNQILNPLITTWAYFIINRGINPDIHAQNALLEIDENGNPTRILYRDFQEFFVDLERRESLGLSTDFKRNILRPEDKVRQIGDRVITTSKERKKVHYSYTYDHKIGRVLDYFSIVLSKFPSCDDEIGNGARRIFRKTFRDLADEIFFDQECCFEPGTHDFHAENLRLGKPKYR